MNNPVRHHYIPVFYLKQWVGSKGRLCQFSRPHKTVKAARKHPEATGYVDGLYTIPGLPPDQAQFVEREFMRLNDDWAAKALQVFTHQRPGISEINTREQVGWARFLYSMMVRTPENIARLQKKLLETEPASIDRIKDQYPLLRAPTDPVTFDEFKQKYLANPVNTSISVMLPQLINSERVITEILRMRFVTADVRDAKHSLLTSDRPIIMSNGLIRPDAHIVMPLSPTRLFIAVRNNSTFDQIMQMTSNQLAYATNDAVALRARTYVYCVDNSQLRFVANRLGKMVPSTPIG